MANENENTYPPEATVGDQWLRRVTHQARDDSTPPLLSPTELHRRVSQVAYQFYLQRGKVRGHDLEDWLAAEALVLHELRTKRAGDSLHG